VTRICKIGSGDNEERVLCQLATGAFFSVAMMNAGAPQEKPLQKLLPPALGLLKGLKWNAVPVPQTTAGAPAPTVLPKDPLALPESGAGSFETESDSEPVPLQPNIVNLDDECGPDGKASPLSQTPESDWSPQYKQARKEISSAMAVIRQHASPQSPPGSPASPRLGGPSSITTTEARPNLLQKLVDRDGLDRDELDRDGLDRDGLDRDGLDRDEDDGPGADPL